MENEAPLGPQQPPRPPLYVPPSPPPRRPSGAWRVIRWAILLLVVGVCLVSVFVNVVTTSLLGGASARSSEDRINEKYISGPTGMSMSAKVAVVSVDGVIMGTEESGPSAWIIKQLKRAKEDSKVKAVILDVDSPGGGITSADIVYKKILDLKSSGKGVIVLMGDVAASGAYYVSAPADKIIAHPTTITGSIGVIVETFNAAGLLQKIGVESVVIKSAPYKDILSPWRPPTEEERKIVQGITDQMFARFKAIIAKGRGMSAEQIDSVATGAIFTADEAVKLDLIDSTGYMEDAIAAAKRSTGIAPGSVTVVRYEKPASLADYIFGSRANGKGQLEEQLNSFLETKKPGFYYLWPGP